MKMNTSLFSLSATYRAEQSLDEEVVELLKGCAILYPRIVMFAGKPTIANIAEEISAGTVAKNRKKAKSFLQPIAEVDPR